MTVNRAQPHPWRVVAFELAVILPTFVLGAVLISRNPAAFDHGVLIFWACLIALVELLPVPAWRGLTISVGFPLLMVVAFLYEPVAAAAVALVGASDHVTTKALYAKDPDGIEFEVSWLVPAELITDEIAEARKRIGPLDIAEEKARFGAQTRGGGGISTPTTA